MRGRLSPVVTLNSSPQSRPRTALRQFFGVPFRRQTYRNLAYLALAFPLGLLYFVGLSVGLSTSFGLAVTVVGAPLFVLTLAVAAGAAGFEAKLATWLVGVEATPPAALQSLNQRFAGFGDLFDATKQLLTAPTTWTGLLLVSLKFVFGLVAFVAIVTAGAVTGSLLTAPLVYDVPDVTLTVGPYVVDTLLEALAIAGLGVLAGLVSLHVFNALATFGGITTAVLLGDGIDSSTDDS
jgi:hypothetical protein